MKKLCLGAMLILMLSGCNTPESFETISDSSIEPQLPPAQQTSMILAEETVQIQQDTGNEKIYLCDDYCVVVQTFSAGDLDATIRSITGFPRDKLTVMERKTGGIDRYECVWVSAGEAGDQVGRMVLLDDGNYHYALTVMAPADQAGELTDTWQLLVDSFTIGEPESTKG